MPLQFVAPAVLSALVVAVMTDADGHVEVGIPEVVGFAAAGLIARRTGSHVLPLVIGLGVYWLGRALLVKPSGVIDVQPEEEEEDG